MLPSKFQGTPALGVLFGIGFIMGANMNQTSNNDELLPPNVLAWLPESRREWKYFILDSVTPGMARAGLVLGLPGNGNVWMFLYFPKVS